MTEERDPATPDARDPSSGEAHAFLSRYEWVLLALILLLGLALRLYHLTEPPIDYLSWRDTQTLMIARNFFREGMNLFHPSVDWRSLSPELASKGTVGGTELQVVPYLTAALYHIFGIQYWVGRVAAIFFALVGTAFFYKLVRRFETISCAVFASLLLTVSPYHLYCGRVQMPEPFAYAMFFAALYFYDKWLSSERLRDGVCAAVACLLTLLGKPQFGIVVFPLAFLTFQRFGWRTFTMPRWYVFGTAVAVPAVAYLAYSFWILAPQSGLSFAGESLLSYRRYLLDPGYYRKIAGAVWTGALTPPVCVLAIVGALVSVRDKRRFLAHAWALGALSFFLLMPGGNIFNGYYHAVLAPPAVILAARAISTLLAARRLRPIAIIVLAVCMGYSLRIAIRLYDPAYLPALHCGQWLDQHTPRDTRILTASPNPATLYFADRIGWTSDAHAFDRDLIQRATALGAAILAVSEDTFDNAYYSQYNAIRDHLYDSLLCQHGEDFAVFSLRNPADLTLPSNGLVAFGTPDSRKYLRGTWGPNQGTAGKPSFVAMGPANDAGIVFTTQAVPRTIAVEISSVTPSQEVSIAVDGRPMGSAIIEQAFQKKAFAFQTPDLNEGDRHVITLHAQRQSEARASILLYAMQIDARPASQ